MLNSYREGVLKFDKEPYLIIKEVAMANGTHYVAAYDYSKEMYKRSNGEVIRKAYAEYETPTAFSTKSVMGKKALSLFGSRNKKVVKELPAKFIAPIVEGTDTFTGKTGLGFYERADDKEINGQFVEGEPTGVFVLLEHIKFGKVTIDEKSILEEADNIQGRRNVHSGDFYDLS